MRPINYQLTNPIINKLIEAERLSTEIKFMEIPDDIDRQLTSSQIGQNIFHIAHMIGKNLTLREADRFISLNNNAQQETLDQILNNYRNAIEYIRSNVNNQYVDLNTNILIHINKLLINNWKEEWQAQIRTDGDMDLQFDNWISLYDDTIDVLQIGKELDSVYDWYKNNISRINALIRIPVFIYRMIQLAPFRHLNKFTIIATSDFLLQKSNYLSHTYLCVAKIFDKNQDDYMKIWQEAIDSPTGNITYWIERFIEDVAGSFTQIKEEIVGEKRKAENSSNQPFLDMNKRQLKILRYLQTIPSVRREDYVQMFDVSTMTAFRDLQELLKKKLIRVEGLGRATKYILANR